MNTIVFEAIPPPVLLIVEGRYQLYGRRYRQKAVGSGQLGRRKAAGIRDEPSNFRPSPPFPGPEAFVRLLAA
jgi:hypothetical protein